MRGIPTPVTRQTGRSLSANVFGPRIAQNFSDFFQDPEKLAALGFLGGNLQSLGRGPTPGIGGLSALGGTPGMAGLSALGGTPGMALLNLLGGTPGTAGLGALGGSPAFGLLGLLTGRDE